MQCDDKFALTVARISCCAKRSTKVVRKTSLKKTDKCQVAEGVVINKWKQSDVACCFGYSLAL